MEKRREASGLFGSGGWLVHAFRAQLTGSAHPTTHYADPNGHRRDDLEAASAWFQLSHFGNAIPPQDAHIKALQQARKLPQSPLGREPRTASGTGAQCARSSANAALSRTPGAWMSLGPQPLNTSNNAANDMQDWGAVTGRVTAVAADPTNAQLVQASRPIVAERPMYFAHNGTQTGGTDVLGYQPIGSCTTNAC